MRRIPVVFALILFVATCGDSASTPDATENSDAMGVDAAPASDAPTTDAHSQNIDGALADAASLMLGPIDCQSDMDCPGDITCNESPPGGICLGCGLTDCGVEFTCFVGACVRDCSDDTDCNIGKRCTAQGRCAIRSCSVSSPCPTPYICSGNLCSRPSCQSAPCPAGLTCDTDSALCME